jgi:transcriptional regulator with XRE-family HTH domain
MAHDTTESSRTDSLGDYLKTVRLGLKMTLRDVEKATQGDISNAYLSQLENSKIENPSPHILHALSQAYKVSYKSLMTRAGYVVPTGAERTSGKKHGSAATFAIENLNPEEERALLEYLAFYRSKKS